MSAANIQESRIEQMAKMPESILNRFKKLLFVQSSSNNEKRMVVYIINELKAMGLDYEIDAIGNILVVKGNAKVYPCIASHMDTVHRIHSSFEIRVNKKQDREIATAWSYKNQVGVGGDDKCGIFACLYMLRLFDNIKVAFFTQEEIGMPGSNEIDTKWFKDVGYIIQLDRWGRGDLICVNGGQSTVNKEFLRAAIVPINTHGYHEEEGLITDSINLWNNNIGISCVNVSCGYYQHHTSVESIDLNEFWNSLCFTKQLITELGEKSYPSSPIYSKSMSAWDRGMLPRNNHNNFSECYNSFDDSYENKKTINDIENEYLYIADEIAYEYDLSPTNNDEDLLIEALVEFNEYCEQLHGLDEIEMDYLKYLLTFSNVNYNSEDEKNIKEKW